MKRLLVALLVVLPVFVLRAQQGSPPAPAQPNAAQDFDSDPRKPVWAYAVSPGARVVQPPPPPGSAAGPNGQAPANGAGGRRGGQPPDPTLHSLPGSKFQFTLAQVRNAFGPADWFPEDHPPMPEVVAHGRAPGARACGFCHMPNGKGRPENAPIAGLPKDYILRQLQEYASGARDTAEPRKPKDMLGISQNINAQDMDDAATYFSSMPWTQWIRVVEKDVIPKTRVAGQMFHVADESQTEPIGVRIIEVPENDEEEQLRAPRTGFLAYVPVGSVAKGEVLVNTGGGGKTVPCVTCHGPDLKGVASIPGIANRSPSYLGRQLYDFQTGARHGVMAPLMKPVVENLTAEDIVNILAYVSSRKP